MAQAEHVEVLSVGRDALFAAITRYEDYPEFVDGVTKVEVERKAAGATRAKYHFSMFKDFTYTLDHSEDPASGRVQWTLVESDLFNKNVGSWQLEALGEKQTRVRYSLDVEFKVPVPGFILKKLVKGNLPSMIKGFEKRARVV